ncbi:MAG: Mannose-6-phosphate isomerase / glucose-6-phosphate isomerase [Candidatus Jorgensenbacteria bacterium GW2011_GWA1_48_11]|uniref:Mannose-6-phosphate isomerase / glucose-6-phosphate isomerase n=1 Tax=Candidatus Jorgensenbacteria bacterium GW2011_GWA1_48_11 TaxID=1618660 RepID=A0A0G1UBN4_9BACT|nr:MAG: Mannose-6-phosphate isomerase / glucose-6-phosphate isomerase [Candidatus Jorgensenbacteria bacterium GW2011_GWA1_48_11]KKW12022.1 MAG: Mannose-6-phosphate isomerase / glucose-6-phosphate isomerase [Candidatus Jorgensenbacteria bacterium GW2011_GWB1_49_9]
MTVERYEENILAFNKQLGFSGLSDYNLGKLKSSRKPDAVMILGMGGSGLPQNIIAKLGPSLGLRTAILDWKDYGLNPYAGFFKNPLFIFISFSGNTAEVISGLQKLIKGKKKKSIAVIAGGGQMRGIAERFNLPFVTYSARGLTPREALGYNYYALIKVLRSVFPGIKTRNLSKRIKPTGFRNAAKNLAKQIGSRITLVYTDSAHSHLGYIWKTNLNETAKLPAFNNVIPEFLHNEITAFENKHYPFFAIFLSDPAAPGIIKEKTEVVRKILTTVKIPNVSLKLAGRNEEEKTWNSIILSHLTGFYLAKINKISPTQTRLIDQLKHLTK